MALGNPLESGEYASLEDLATANGVDRTYVGRILRLLLVAAPAPRERANRGAAKAFALDFSTSIQTLFLLLYSCWVGPMKHAPLLACLGLLLLASILSGQESGRREPASPGLLKLWSRDDLVQVRIIGLSHDQKILLTEDHVEDFRLRDVETGLPLGKQPPIKGYVWFAFVPGRSLCVYVNQSEDFIRLWDISRGEWLGDPISAYTDSPGGDGGVTWPQFSSQRGVHGD